MTDHNFSNGRSADQYCKVDTGTVATTHHKRSYKSATCQDFSREAFIRLFLILRVWRFAVAKAHYNLWTFRAKAPISQSKQLLPSQNNCSPVKTTVPQ